MRPDHITPGHAGIPSTEGYSRDLEGTRQWLEDVLQHADTDTCTPIPIDRDLSRLQRWALRSFGLWSFVRARERSEFDRGRRFVAQTALSTFLSPSPAPKGWSSTD